MTETKTEPNGGMGDEQEFVLKRDLAEVHLLLDNISGSLGKALPAKLTAGGLFDTTKPAGEKSWLEQICEVTWPPDSATKADIPGRAAKILYARDLLNAETAPATGLSIAFTLLMTGEFREAWWARLGRWISRQRSEGDPVPNGETEKYTSRVSLAKDAYPALYRNAPRYRLMLRSLLYGIWLVLAATCLFSWDVTAGSSLLNRVVVLDKQIADTAAEAKKASLKPPAQAPADNAEGAATKGGLKDGIVAPGLSTDELNRNAAIESLKNWMLQETTARWALRSIMGGPAPVLLICDPQQSHLPAGCRKSTDRAEVGTPPQAYLEWAQAFIGILSGTILPVCYGMLGAWAAVLRVVSRQLNDSTLVPRDLTQAALQLALGALIGACVGIFVTADGTASSGGGLLSTVPLTASALCFVAGFGVEGVFKALEELVRRVFNLS